MAAYVDGEVDQVEIFYNGYISPISQVVRRETLLPLQQATILDESDERRGRRRRASAATRSSSTSPIPRRSSRRLVPDYVEISIYRALLESTASEHGARMTAMRNASENAGDADRGPDAGDEPCPPGRDHAGDHGSRRRRRGRSKPLNNGDTMSATAETPTTEDQERRPDRGDPGRRDRGRVPGQAPGDQPRDHDQAARGVRAEETEDIAAAHESCSCCEVQQHLGDDRVRAVAMDTTDGLVARHRGGRHRRADHGAGRPT